MMTPDLLKTIGLTDSQAKTYLLLIEKGELSPPEVSKLSGESRTNTYMILDKLASLGLIEKSSNNNRISYRSLNPVAIEKLVEERRKQFIEAEQAIKHAMPKMLSYFYTFTEKPGIRLLEGVEGLKEIYADTLRTKQDIYFLRTPKEIQTLGDEYFEKYKKRRADLGIATYAFTTEKDDSRQYSQSDKIYNVIRTWLPEESYTASVEVDVYGDKTAFLSYGEDVMGVIIQSPTIATAMKQLLLGLSKNE